MSTAWQTDRRISRVLQSTFDCLLSLGPDFLSSQTRAFSSSWHWFISRLRFFYQCARDLFLFSLHTTTFLHLYSILKSSDLQELMLLFWHFMGYNQVNAETDHVSVDLLMSRDAGIFKTVAQWLLTVAPNFYIQNLSSHSDSFEHLQLYRRQRHRQPWQQISASDWSRR